MRRQPESAKALSGIRLASSGKANMNDEEEKKHGEGKGFAGLSSMVSDVDDVVSSKPKQPQKPHSEPPLKQNAGGSGQPKQTSAKPASQPYQATAQPSGGSSGGKWLIGIAVVIGLIWLANQSDNSRPSKSAYSPGTSSTSTVPASQPAIAQPQASTRPSESKPSVGRNNVLSTGQIRYCLAEKIRLDASEAVLNNYSDSDVDRFNAYVNDYNSRCGEFRYRQGALESARRDVEPYRSQLQAEGQGRFVRSPTATARAPTSAPASKPAPPTPDSTVLAVQRRLNELGYNAGTPDGLFGNKTRAAIKAFQQDTGIFSDGIANPALLQQLQKSKGSLTDRYSVPETTSSSRTQSNSGLPRNSKLASWGSDWVCNKGYYKSGNECLAVQIPRNGSLASWGSDWACDKGYFKSGNKCLAVQIPKNGSLASWGSDWVCDKGYFKSGNKCLAVQIPKNGSLASWGSDWVCNKGYYKSGNECLAVQIPRNGSLASWGSDWVCDKGYFKSGNKCLAVQIPKNGSLASWGSDWVCNPGYRKIGDRCDPI
jgi:peptidoglycan hydrolase-like protein with peptidoglycan-binding domain